MTFTSKWRIVVVMIFLASSFFLWALLDGYRLRWEMTLIPLFFAIQILLADLVEYYVLNYMGLKGRWFSVVMAPGTILHELSHLMAALFTGCTITDVSFFKFNPRSNVLGYVNYAQPKDKWIVLRSFLVGFAPFLGCGIMLVLLNMLLNGVIVLDDFNSVDAISENFIHLVSSYYTTSANPLFLALVAYLSVCFALGSAPSMVDIKEFFYSMPKHIFSFLFFLGLLYTIVHLGEIDLALFGYRISDVTVFLFDLSIYVQLTSISVFIASIPLLLASDKFIELSLQKRLLVFLTTILVYLISKIIFNTSDVYSTILAAVAFITSLVFLRWPTLFFKSKPVSSRS